MCYFYTYQVFLGKCKIIRQSHPVRVFVANSGFGSHISILYSRIGLCIDHLLYLCFIH